MYSSRLLEVTKEDKMKPVYNLKYVHFSEAELEWICEKNGVSYSSRIKDMKSFIAKYPDLRALENSINNGTYKWYKTRKFSWYFTNLLFFKRFKLPIGFFYNIRVCSKEIINYEEDIRNLLTDMRTIGLNRRGYSESHVSNNILTEITRIILYSGDSVNSTIYNINDYEESLKENGLFRRLQYYSAIKSILNEMNFIIDGYKIREYNVKSSSELFMNNSIEFREAFDNYLLALRINVKYKSTKTEASHLRQFFNFMSIKYPECHEIARIQNENIIQYINFQKETVNIRGKRNTAATINHRVESLRKFFDYYITEKKYNITKNVITKYDKLKESKKFPQYISTQDFLKLLKAIKDIDESKYVQEKMILILLLDTGRRIHEIITLKYNCLENEKVFFHKLKQGTAHWQKVGAASIAAIIKLKEYARNVETELYTPLDGLTIRRLLPSKRGKGKNVVSYNSVARIFAKIQKNNDIVDENGKPIFTLHDNKRNFVTNMLAAGVSSKEISKILGQEIGSLLPYEINNKFAIETLKRVEDKCYLAGKNINSDINNSLNVTSKLNELLTSTDVINRNKQNLLFKMKNAENTMPLILGCCMDNDFVNICGDLICLTCKNIWLDEENDVKKVEDFIIKILKHIYDYKRYQKINDFEKIFASSIIKFFGEVCKLEDKQIKNKLAKLKKIAREELKDA